MSSKQIDQCKPRVYAHRGASGNYFENTMSAFRGAVKEKADGIKLDIQRSKDGIFFVIHDKDLFRVTGVRENISDLNASDIQKLVVGRKFIRTIKKRSIPMLSSVISFALIEEMGLNVELKETISECPECLPSLLEQLAVLEDVHVSSFDYELVKKIKELNPDMEAALLLRKSMLKNQQLTDYSAADAFHFHKRMMKEPFLSQWKETDKKIRVYGVDGTEPYIQNPPSYIDGWITDYPSRFQSCHH